MDAITAYEAGHILAQQLAATAGKSGDPSGKLQFAYAVNAFADHFLTDLFSAGHMRTPRRGMYEYSGLLSAAASGVCAKAMHDEDSKFGLWVTNARGTSGDTWVAFGDGRYRDWCNAANRAILKAAVQQSMDDVWAAFSGRPVAAGPDSAVRDYLPES